MLTHPTLDQLRALKLDGMAQAFVELEAQEEVSDLAHAEWLALLLDREAANRNTRRFQIRLRAARLRHSQAAIEDVDYRTPRRLDQALFQQLATCRWIAEHRGLLVTCPCGVVKSWLSCALAQKACRDGYTVHYARVPRLFTDLDLAHGDGRFARLFRMLVRVDLLVLDLCAVRSYVELRADSGADAVFGGLQLHISISMYQSLLSQSTMLVAAEAI